jgi:peptide/nickel transport system permease protein
MAATDIVYSKDFVNYTGLNVVDAVLNRQWFVFWDGLRHMILPSISYAIGGLAASTRLMRASLLSNFEKGYVDTAIMKGLSERRIINRHILRNAMLPCVTFLGMQIPALLGGSVVVETIFNYPGMGTFIVTAAQGLDFPAIIASSLAISVLIIISNLLVDILYGLLNPAVRVE